MLIGNLEGCLESLLNETQSHSGCVFSEGEILISLPNTFKPEFNKNKYKPITLLDDNKENIYVPIFDNKGTQFAQLYLCGGNYDKHDVFSSSPLPLYVLLHKQNKLLNQADLRNDLRNHDCEDLDHKDRENFKDKAKNLLIANVSHELRTPLNAVMGMLALLEDTALDDHQWECIEVMRDAALDLLVLINDILDISKLEAGEMQLYPTSTKLQDCIESASKLLAQVAYDKNLYLNIEISKEIPEFIIIDSNRLKQMLKNLLSNAVKFTNKGGVTLKVSLASVDDIEEMNLIPHDSPPKKTKSLVPDQFKKLDVVNPPSPAPEEIGNRIYLKFEVIDTGIGIAKENIPKLFKSFSQLEETNTKEYQGTGLGLAITSQLTELMHGKINVKSKLNEGSTFYFIIPTKIHKKGRDFDKDLSILKDKNFLIVDDNSKNLMRLTALLDKWGVSYRECESSSRAIISYVGNARYKFDLGLLDIVMPGINGNDLAVKIASSYNSFPLIALSSAQQQINSISPAFSAHLTKPYDDDELLDTILRVLSSQPTQPTQSIQSTQSTQKIKHLNSLNNISSKDILEFKKNNKDKDKETKPRKKSKSTTPSPTKRKHSIPKKTIKNPNIKILVVEDKERNLKMLLSMLQAIGITSNIAVARDGEEAVQKAIEFNYDVILMDIIMPKKDGMEATKEILNYYKNKKAPKIIAVTARVTDNALDEYYSIGMSDVLFKPITQINELIDVL